jgi:hypothetical protein
LRTTDQVASEGTSDRDEELDVDGCRQVVDQVEREHRAEAVGDDDEVTPLRDLRKHGSKARVTTRTVLAVGADLLERL